MLFQWSKMGLLHLKCTSGSMFLRKVESTQREGTQFKMSSLCNGSVNYQFLNKERARLKCKRGHSFIVATGPAIEAPVIGTEPLTKDDLIDYMLSGCKPKEKWRSPIYTLNCLLSFGAHNLLKISRIMLICYYMLCIYICMIYLTCIWVIAE